VPNSTASPPRSSGTSTSMTLIPASAFSFSEIMRQPWPPQSKKGSRLSLHEFKPEKVYLLVAKLSRKKKMA
jgi:hypothetical protein